MRTDDGPVFPVMALAIDVQWLSGLTCKNIFDAEGDHIWSFGIVDDHTDFPSEILAELEVIDDAFAQVLLCETGSGSSFSPTDLLVIAAALQRISKTVPTSGVELIDLSQTYVHNVKVSQMVAK